MSETLPPHPDGANYLYSASGGKNIHLPVGYAEDGIRQLVIDELDSKRRRLAEVPHDETGLDTQRVASFLENHGLSLRPFVAVDEDGQQAINEIIEYNPGDILTTGSHITPVDFIYVLRGAREAANGPGVIEAALVHEQIHANHPYWDILAYEREDPTHGIGYYPLRNGFKCNGFGLHVRNETQSEDPEDDPVQGNFFEEGLAVLMEHKYRVEKLGLPNGFLDRAEPQRVSTDAGVSYLLPGCYLYKGTETGKLAWSVSANAAYGMQLLIAKDPDIFPAMLAARKGVDGLREFARRVDALDTGLYRTLRQHPYEAKRFIEGTRYIIDRLYGGDQEEALAAVAEQDYREDIAA